MIVNCLQGDFAKKNGAGFIATNVNLIDPEDTCQCDKKFPSFYFTLNGYNGQNENEKCAKFDREP